METKTKSAKEISALIPARSASGVVGYRGGYAVAYEVPVYGQMGEWETCLLDVVMSKALAHRVVRANQRST